MNNKIIKIMQNPAILSLVLFLLFGICFQSNAQEVKKVGTSAAAFLRIPVGAKAIAMGSAFTATADDGSAMFWNPGNISTNDRPELFIHHSPWLPGLDYNYFGITMPIAQFGVFGVNVSSLQTAEMDITTVEAPMGTGETFTAASTAVGIVFARSLTDRFSIGANFKYIQERIFHSNAIGFGFDVGTMFVSPFKDVRFGVSVSNVGTNMKMNGEDLNAYIDVAPNQEGNNDNIVAQLKTDSFELPIILRLGVAWDWNMSQGTRLTFACDGVNPNDNGQSLNLGCELASFNESVFLRAGFNELFLEDREKGLTAGAGMRLPMPGNLNFSLNYAYQTFEYLGAVNHFSIQMQF